MGWLATVKILSGGDWQENQAFSSGLWTVNREVDWSQTTDLQYILYTLSTYQFVKVIIFLVHGVPQSHTSVSSLW